MQNRGMFGGAFGKPMFDMFRTPPIVQPGMRSKDPTAGMRQVRRDSAGTKGSHAPNAAMRRDAVGLPRAQQSAVRQAVVSQSPGKKKGGMFSQGGKGWDAVALIGGMLRDLDGTMGGANFDNAMAGIKGRRQQEQLKQEQLQQDKAIARLVRDDPKLKALADLDPEGFVKAMTAGSIPSFSDMTSRDRLSHDVQTDKRDFEVSRFRDERDFQHTLDEAGRMQSNADRAYGRGVFESDRTYTAGRDDESFDRANPRGGISMGLDANGNPIMTVGGPANPQGGGFIGGAGSRYMQSSDAKQIEAARTSANDAIAVMSALDEAEALMMGADGEYGTADDYKTGPYAGLAGQAGRFAPFLPGTNSAKGSNYEQATALSKTLGLDGLRALGGNDTERELLTSIQTTFGPDKLGATNKKIIERQRAVMDIMGPFKSQFMERWAAENGSTSRTNAGGQTFSEALAAAQRQRAIELGLLSAGRSPTAAAPSYDVTGMTDDELLATLGVE